MISAASNQVSTKLGTPPVPQSPWHILVYSHTHWDREWYQSFERFRMQLIGCVDRILDLLETDERFTCFVLDGQTIVIDDYLAIRPEARNRIERLTQGGRLEVGPWYILPDEFLVSAESFVRNLQAGSRGATALGGAPRVGYLPDPFGHIGMMPTILNGFGIDSAVFSRGMGDEFHELGTEFRWRSPDGEGEVLALVQTSPYTNGYCNAELASIRYGDAPERTPVELPRLAQHLADRSNTGVLLFAAGCDHAYPSAELVQHLSTLQSELEGVTVEIAGMRRYRQLIHERIAAPSAPQLGSFEGELRGSLHAPILAAIFSARIELKADNVRIQDELERVVEPILALGGGGQSGVSGRADFELLRHAWSLTLKNQPHDSIGGCSVDAVHEEMPARTLRAHEVARGLVEESVLRFGFDGSQDLVFNPHPRKEQGLVWLLDGSPKWIAGVPALGLAKLDEVVADGRARVAGPHAIESEALRVEVDAGEVRLTLHPGFGGSFADGLPVTGESVLGFIDEADAGDEYDFGALASDKPIRAALVTSEAKQLDGGVAQLTLTHSIGLPRSLSADRLSRSSEVEETILTTTLTIAGDDPLVHATTSWENRALDHRLRLTVRAPQGAKTAIVDGHWHVLERPAVPYQGTQDWKQVPPHSNHLDRWAAVEPGQHGPGVAIVTEGLHEYELVVPSGQQDHGYGPDHPELQVTLQRSVGWLSRDDIQGRPGHAGPGLPTPGAQGLGERSVSYSLSLTTTQWQDGKLPRILGRTATRLRHIPAVDEQIRIQSGHRARAWDINDRLAHAGGIRQPHNMGIVVDSDAELSACKPAEDGSGDVILRLWNPYDTASNTSVSLPSWCGAVVPVRLDESVDEAEEQVELSSQSDGRNSFALMIPARAVKSWRFSQRLV